MKKILALAVLVSLVPAASVFADVCSEDCPSGQHKVSFADGDAVTCYCTTQQQAMQDNGPGSAEHPNSEQD